MTPGDATHDYQEIQRELHEKLSHGYRLRHDLDFARVFQDAWHETILGMTDLPPESRALDLGCGTGDFLTDLRRRFPRAVGIDLSEAMLREGPREVRGRGLVAAAEGLPFRDGSFDLVVCKGSLHHTADLDGALAEIHRVLRPGGQLVLSEPCNDSLPIRAARWILYRASSHFHPGDVAYRSRDFLRGLEARGLRVLARRKIGYLAYALAGFPDHFGGMRHVPFRVPITRGLVALDRGLARVPVLRGLGFHLLASCRREVPTAGEDAGAGAAAGDAAGEEAGAANPAPGGPLAPRPAPAPWPREGRRLLLVTDSLADTDGIGRIAGVYLRRCAGAFEAIDVLLARRHPPIAPSLPLPPHVRLHPVLPESKFLYRSAPRFLAALGLALARALPLARRASLVHSLKEYPYALVAGLAAHLARRPFLASLHGTYAIVPLDLPLHRGLVRWVYRHAAALVFGSPFTRRRLEERLRARGESDLLSRTVEVPYGVDAAAGGAGSAGGGPVAGGASRGRVILSIGEVKERKGTHILLEAFTRLAGEFPDLRLDVAGRVHDGDPYTAALRERAARAGVGERFRLLGPIDEEDKGRRLREATLFALASTQSREGGFEGFGLVFLEAAAAGCVSVGSRGCGAEDAIAEGVSGRLVPAGDPAALAAALRELLLDDEARARLGASARAFAATRDWSRSIERLQALWARYLAAPSPRTTEGSPRTSAGNP